MSPVANLLYKACNIKHILTKLKYIFEYILDLFSAFRIQFEHLLKDKVSYSLSMIEKSKVDQKVMCHDFGNLL